MKKTTLLALILLPLAARAFTLISFTTSPATPLVWYTAESPSEPFSTQLVGVIDSDELAWSSPETSGTLVAGTPGFTITRLSTRMTAGVGAGSITMRCTDGANHCNCDVSCTAAGDTTWTCSGGGGTGCRYSGTTPIFCAKSTNCPTTNPSSKDIMVYGTRNGEAPEGVDFVPRFVPYGLFGLDGGGTFFGTDSYQFDTITCGWSSPGVVSGGTDTLRVQLIQKSDAGVVCTCDLPGACNDAAGTEHTCSCSGGRKFVGTSVEPGSQLGKGYAIQLHSATNCAVNPAGMRCAIPFRK